MSNSNGQLRIAIIGSGISGLVAAERLSKDHEVTVFEANDRIGGHTNTVSVSLLDGSYNIDTGFIVYNEIHYPRFSRLLDRLNVASKPTSMSFSVRRDSTGLEYNGTSLNSLFVQRRNLLNPAFLGMIYDILRFNREAPKMLTGNDDNTGTPMSVQEYVDEHKYGKAFTDNYLVPLGASLWSVPAGRFRTFPIAFVVAFLNNHCMLQIGGRPVWRVIDGGSHRYVEKLTSSFIEQIRLKSPVTRVRRSDGGVHLRMHDGSWLSFDHVVFACHADQALRLLEAPTTAEREILSAFPYQPNVATLHTDTSLLPRSQNAWASWNAFLPDGDPDQIAVTYNMNMLQSIRSRDTFCVTLNSSWMIDESKVLKRIHYHHPIYTRRQQAMQARHDELQCANNTSFCGAYWGYGFHEDGVRSAQLVCDALEAVVMREVIHA